MKLKDVAEYIEDITYFDVELEEDCIYLRTRENGNVGDEEIGQEDEDEAYKVVKTVLDKFKDLVANVEFVDEWVHVDFKSSKIGEHDVNNLPKGTVVDGHGFLNPRTIIDERHYQLKYYNVEGGQIVNAYDIDKII
tara:strand:+ start:23806 stop:24213 length:408 start_codon:yes stop_codon:yes gene_type:complete